MGRPERGTIRPYAEDDLASVLEVWYRASLIAHAFVPEGFFERERAEITDRLMPIAETTVYEIDDTIVGFVSTIGNEVGAIFVDPGSQGAGIGRALMDAVSVSRPYLELNVFERNEIGRRFYDAYGFEFKSRHHNLVAGEPELRLRFAPSHRS